MTNLIKIFDNRFFALHNRSVECIKRTPMERLFWSPVEKNALFPLNSCGEWILRSSGAVEQTFGGITTRLWDDPFEWTLPEKLSTPDLILEYLNETEETRRKGFGFFKSDEDLKMELPAPQKLKSIAQLLIETLAKAENFQGRAFAIFNLFSNEKMNFS